MDVFVLVAGDKFQMVSVGVDVRMYDELFSQVSESQDKTITFVILLLL